MNDDMTGQDFLDTLGSDGRSIPLFLRDMTLGMDVLGIRTTDVFGEGFDPNLSAESIVAFQRFTGQDAVIGCTHSATFIIEQFGGKMRVPEYGVPLPIVHPFATVIDFSDLDTEPKGKMVSAIESYSKVRQKLPSVSVVGNVTGPLTKAGVLAGMERLSMLMLSDMDVLTDMLDVCLDNTERIIERLCDDGSIDAGIIAAATDNPDLFGVDAYRDVSVPWTRKITDMFRTVGLPSIYHPHGTFAKGSLDILDLTFDVGYDGFHYPENNDLHIISKRMGKRYCILGGTDIVPYLTDFNESALRSETMRHLQAFEGDRFVFMASCSLHRGTDLDSVRYMVDLVRSHTAVR